MTEARGTGDPEGEYRRALAENERYVAVFDRSRLTATPTTRLAVVTCMDARIDLQEALGLRIGDAHVVRNAGAFATEDVIRSLVVSQALLGTGEIILIGHTGCGLQGASDDDIRRRVLASTGRPTDLAFGSFDDVVAHVRDQLAILRDHPALRRVPVHGLVYDVTTGRLAEVA